MRLATRLGTVAVIGWVLAGCGAPPGSVIMVDAAGFRTFSLVPRDPPLLCTLGAAIGPVAGSLEGSALAAPEPVWLRNASGRRLSIVWPAGFSARFEPDLVLYDPGGRPVARASQRVELPQVSLAAAQGTYDDPYIASGLVFDGCYPYVP